MNRLAGSDVRRAEFRSLTNIHETVFRRSSISLNCDSVGRSSADFSCYLFFTHVGCRAAWLRASLRFHVPLACLGGGRTVSHSSNVFPHGRFVFCEGTMTECLPKS